LAARIERGTAAWPRYRCVPEQDAIAMPLDPVILMVLGAALIVVVVVYQQPRMPTGRLRRTGAGGAGSHPQGDQAAREAGVTVRDVLGWLGALLGLAAIAYGLYLRYVVGSYA
jgi:hypothetical protein